MTIHATIDYGAVLFDLKSKRKQLDEAIQHIERMAKSGILNQAQGNLFSNEAKPAGNKYAGLGVYAATVELLREKRRTMKTTEIKQSLAGLGVVSDSALANVAPTLYKAVKKKPNCQIELVGTGEWGLVSQ